MSAEMNLASRPFMNRLPHGLLLGALLAVGVGLTAWNGSLFLSTKSEARAVEAQLDVLAREEDDLARRRQLLLVELAAADLASLTDRVTAANSVLSEKSLSWTLLLERLQERMPWQAALNSIRTTLREGTVELAVDLRAKSESQYLEFLDAVEASPCFSNVYPSVDERAPTGDFTANVKATYDPACGRNIDTATSGRKRSGAGRAGRGGRTGGRRG